MFGGYAAYSVSFIEQICAYIFREFILTGNYICFDLKIGVRGLTVAEPYIYSYCSTDFTGKSGLISGKAESLSPF